MRLRKLVRMAAAGCVAAAAVAVVVEPTQGQYPPGGYGGPPGGFGDRGRGERGPGGFGGGDRGPGGFSSRGGGDADGSFNRLLQTTGQSTGDVIDYSRIPPQSRQMLDGFRQRMGQPPLPTSGTITRDQFRVEYAQRQATMGQMRPGGFGGSPGMSATPGGAPQPATMTFATAPGMAQPAPGTSFSPGGYGGQPGGYGGPPGGYGGQPGGFDPRRDRGPGGPGGGFDPSTMTDDQIRDMMRRTDQDQDGRISAVEAQRSDRLRDGFVQYDANKDGYIDLAEYRGYMVARAVERSRDPRNQDPNAVPGGSYPYQPGQPGGSFPFPGGPQQPNAVPEDARPVVFRYGKLPTKELPGWFTELDTDKDGQVGLYQWRAEGKAIADFQALDLNGDGFVTAEEHLRGQKPQAADKGAAAEGADGSPGASANGERGRGERGGNPFTRGKDGGGGKDDRKSRDKGSNPFNKKR